MNRMVDGKTSVLLAVRLSATAAVQFLLFFSLAISPVHAEQMQKNSSVVTLELSFADPNWDGTIIPKGQQCKEFGGNGSSPAILVKDIPLQANSLVIEFSDATYKPCDNGGHGTLGYAIPNGAKSILLPSIPGQTFDLPAGFSLIKEHCGADLGMQAGAYIGPCPGLGNSYYVTIKALHQSPDKTVLQIVGIGRLDFGTYEQ